MYFYSFLIFLKYFSVMTSIWSHQSIKYTQKKKKKHASINAFQPVSNEVGWGDSHLRRPSACFPIELSDFFSTMRFNIPPALLIFSMLIDFAGSNSVSFSLSLGFFLADVTGVATAGQESIWLWVSSEMDSLQNSQIRNALLKILLFFARKVGLDRKAFEFDFVRFFCKSFFLFSSVKLISTCEHSKFSGSPIVGQSFTEPKRYKSSAQSEWTDL